MSKPDKRRYYLTARGSATESAALLDVCFRLKLLDAVGHKAGKETLVRVVSMLIKLAQACEGVRFAATASRSRWRPRPRSCEAFSRTAWRSDEPV